MAQRSKAKSERRRWPDFCRYALLLGFALSFCCLFGLSGEALAAKSKNSAGNPRYAALVMDAETGAILHQKYADKKLYPASLVKIMTLLMTFEAIEQGKLTLRDRVPISRHAASMVPSKLDLPVGSSIRVEDAIYALVTKSANDIAVALAEKVAGTESQFAVMMTRRARQIGLTATTFRNASGLHDPEQVTTARDMAKLAQFILNRYPHYYEYFSTRQFSYQGKSYHNHNRLMEKYPGMDGFKTGYIGASGFNLVASARRGGTRLIGVVFGGRTATSRNDHMRILLDNGFKKSAGGVLVAETEVTPQSKAPLPGRKPQAGAVLAAVTPAAGTRTATAAIEDMGQWAEMNPMLQNKAFQELIGEGDYDPAETKRFETGLLAIAAVKGVYSDARLAHAIQPLAPRRGGDWSIQVGAFESRVKTDQAIRISQKSLPAELTGATPVIVPLRTREGWLFRGRLAGFTRDEALRACALLNECLPISPQAN